MTHLSIERLI